MCNIQGIGIIKLTKSIQQYQKALTESNKTRIQQLISRMNRHDEIIEANIGPMTQDVKKFLDSLTPEQMEAYKAQIITAFKH